MKIKNYRKASMSLIKQSSKILKGRVYIPVIPCDLESFLQEFHFDFEESTEPINMNVIMEMTPN